jgi:hypothetical protein
LFGYLVLATPFSHRQFAIAMLAPNVTRCIPALRRIGTGTGALYSYSDYGMIYNVSSRRQMTIDGNGVISDGVERRTAGLATF